MLVLLACILHVRTFVVKLESCAYNKNKIILELNSVVLYMLLISNQS